MEDFKGNLPEHVECKPNVYNPIKEEPSLDINEVKMIDLGGFKWNLPQHVECKPNVYNPIKEEPPLDINEVKMIDLGGFKWNLPLDVYNPIKEEPPLEINKGILLKMKFINENSTENINCQPKVIDTYPEKEELYDDLILKSVQERSSGNKDFNKEITTDHNHVKTVMPLAINDGNFHLSPDVSSKKNDVVITKDRGCQPILERTEPKGSEYIEKNLQESKQQKYWKCIERNSCPYCQFRGQSEFRLLKHFDENHRKEKPFNCRSCSYWACTMRIFEAHLRQIHHIYQYRKCSFNADSRLELNDHRQKNHKYKRSLTKRLYQCAHCSFRSNKKSNLETHIHGFHLKTIRYKCDYCDYTCIYNTTIRNHIEAAHLPNIKCKYCKYISKTKRAMKDHILAVHLKEKNIICPLCNFKTSRRRLLKSHHKRMHLNIKPTIINKKFVCYHCSKIFIGKYNLKIHILVRHLKKKPFECKICKWKFKSYDRRSFHIAIKHSVKKFVCKECDYRARRKDYLDKHVISCHTNNKPFKCPYCKHSSARMDNIKAHVKRVHNM